MGDLGLVAEQTLGSQPGVDLVRGRRVPLEPGSMIVNRPADRGRNDAHTGVARILPIVSARWRGCHPGHETPVTGLDLPVGHHVEARAVVGGGRVISEELGLGRRSLAPGRDQRPGRHLAYQVAHRIRLSGNCLGLLTSSVLAARGTATDGPGLRTGQGSERPSPSGGAVIWGRPVGFQWPGSASVGVGFGDEPGLTPLPEVGTHRNREEHPRCYRPNPLSETRQTFDRGPHQRWLGVSQFSSGSPIEKTLSAIGATRPARGYCARCTNPGYGVAGWKNGSSGSSEPARPGRACPPVVRHIVCKRCALARSSAVFLLDLIG